MTPSLILASASPRRQELLAQIGVAFEVRPSNILEVRGAGESPEEYVTRVARDKAEFVARATGECDQPIVGADTEVVLDGEVLGKPRDEADARAMLARLAGRSHEVLTALCLIHQGKRHEALSRSVVWFAPLDAEAIARYVATGEPMGKAGSYAIQGRAAAFIARIEGSYSGIMGLPLYELGRLLATAGR